MYPPPVCHPSGLLLLVAHASLLGLLLAQLAAGAAHSTPPRSDEPAPERVSAHSLRDEGVTRELLRRRPSPETRSRRAALERLTTRPVDLSLSLSAPPADIARTSTSGPHITVIQGLDVRPPKRPTVKLKTLLADLGLPPVKDGAVRFASLPQPEGLPDVDLFAGPLQISEGDRTYLGAKLAVRW